MENEPVRRLDLFRKQCGATAQGINTSVFRQMESRDSGLSGSLLNCSAPKGVWFDSSAFLQFVKKRGIMKRVVVESPFAGNITRNVRYARAAMRDCLLRGESPYASHLLYTQVGVLDDFIPAERELGIKAGFEWRQSAEKTVVYIDFGVSKGMQYGIQDAEERGCPVEYRTLEGFWADKTA